MKKLLVLIGSVLLSLSAGAIGSLATIPNIPAWYQTLEKPFFSPPNWLFGPVWTTLYVLMGIALYLVITAKSEVSKRDAYTMFGIQLLLNALWPIVFFGLHLPYVGLAVIVVLLVAIVITLLKFRTFSKFAAALLVPYILWVSFATCLNLAIALLN